MVQFLSKNFFLGFLQFLLGFSKFPVFLCHSVYTTLKDQHGLSDITALSVTEVELRCNAGGIGPSCQVATNRTAP